MRLRLGKWERSGMYPEMAGPDRVKDRGPEDPGSFTVWIAGTFNIVDDMDGGTAEDALAFARASFMLER